MLAIHLFNHESLPERQEESRIQHLHEHLRWEQSFVRRVVDRALERGVVVHEGDDRLALTPTGRDAARRAIGSV